LGGHKHSEIGSVMIREDLVGEFGMFKDEGTSGGAEEDRSEGEEN